MIKWILNICLVMCVLTFLTACKKKTTITVKVFNPALNEYLSGAIVSLLEIKETTGLFGTKTTCSEIATSTTDVNGKMCVCF